MSRKDKQVMRRKDQLDARAAKMNPGSKSNENSKKISGAKWTIHPSSENQSDAPVKTSSEENEGEKDSEAKSKS